VIRGSLELSASVKRRVVCVANVSPRKRAISVVAGFAPRTVNVVSRFVRTAQIFACRFGAARTVQNQNTKTKGSEQMSRQLLIVIRDDEMNDICRTRRRAVYDDFPKIVCLCGSTRFMDAFQAANLRETLAGNIVLSVGCNTKSDASLFGGLSNGDLHKVKESLDSLHKRKIDLADEIFVLNVGGYIGDSTRSEIEYAYRQHKQIRFLEPDVDVSFLAEVER
jgi:hypothetical protein